MPARPLTRAQALQNAAFLRELRRTGNAREAARAIGAHRATLTKRRAKHPAFAAEWDAALALADAALSILPAKAGRGTAPRSGVVEGCQTPGDRRPRRDNPAQGEPRAVKTRTGRYQLRRCEPGRLDRAGEQRFLAALAATANVRLSAAAAGFSHSAFYWHARKSPAFAREMRMALTEGYDRVEMALLESWDPFAARDDAWRHNDPPPIPSMTPDQAIHLLRLHMRTARLQQEPGQIKRRRGEPMEVYRFRLTAMAEQRRERDREAFRVAEAARAEERDRSPHEHEAPVLPALDQVTGWSKADPAKRAWHEERALFGGWRLEDWEGRGR